MSGAVIRGQESGEEPAVGWTRAELLAVAALLAVLMTGTGWVIWDRYSLRTAYGEASGAAAAEMAGAGAGGRGAAPAGAEAAEGESSGAGEQGSAAQPDSAQLFVHVAGAVRAPGVYRLAAGARVVDAVTAAGGASAGGRPDVLNLAAPLVDGDRVYIPTAAEVAAAASAGGLQSSSQGGLGASGVWSGQGSGKVDINHADAAGLELLPGVGPSLAAAILAYRDEHGPFRTLADLEKVPGIGPAKLAVLRDRIVLR